MSALSSGRRWTQAWQMDFNLSKCHVLSASRKKKTLKYVYAMGGVKLRHGSHHPYLGVEIASNPKWGHNLKNTISKAIRSLHLLRHNLYNCTPKTKGMVYKALVRPTLEYVSSTVETLEEELHGLFGGCAERLWPLYKLLDWKSEIKTKNTFVWWYESLYHFVSAHILSHSPLDLTS